MKTVTLLAAVVLFGACSGEPEKIHLRTEKGPRKEVSNVEANSLLTMDVQGMSCEMGCSGSIRKELKSTGAVARVKFDFVEDADVQKAYVSFDSSKITAEEMINLVEKMDDNKFSVGKHSVQKLEKSDVDSETTSKPASDDTEASLEMNEGGFEMPNLLHLLKDLVVQ